MSLPAEKKYLADGVPNLVSLFRVCAFALDGADEYEDTIRNQVTQDIRQVLEWGTELATDMLVAEERPKRGA